MGSKCQLQYFAVFHSTLTGEQSNTNERIQRTCLKIIFGDMYINYSSALEMSGLDRLSDRHSKRCLHFSLKSIKHHRNNRLFPINHHAGAFNSRNSEKFQVNFASTSAYRDSTIPSCQRLLNAHFKTKWAIFNNVIIIYYCEWWSCLDLSR